MDPTDTEQLALVAGVVGAYGTFFSVCAAVSLSYAFYRTGHSWWWIAVPLLFAVLFILNLFLPMYLSLAGTFFNCGA